MKRKAKPERERDPSKIKLGWKSEKMSMQDQRELDAMNAELKRRGRHWTDPQRFAQMERLYAMLQKMGVEPGAVSLPAEPGMLGFDELCESLKVPADKRSWLVITEYLKDKATAVLLKREADGKASRGTRKKSAAAGGRPVKSDIAADDKYVAAYQEARANGATAKEFASKRGKTPKEHGQLLDRVYRRNRRTPDKPPAKRYLS